jgi:hypothetical protein
MFPGTRVPVTLLLDHLDRGGDLTEFVARYPAVSKEMAAAACALGLEALLANVPLEPRSAQRSLLPRTDRQGVITNAEELAVGSVIGKRVLCPSCRQLVFKSWPEGWDGHAARRCRGLPRGSAEMRKTEFKTRYGHLFR